MVELVVQIALLLLVPLFGVLLHQWPLRWSAGGHDDKQNGKKQQFFHSTLCLISSLDLSLSGFNIS